MNEVARRRGGDMVRLMVARGARHGNIFGVKEATGDIDRLKAIQALVDEDFVLYSGDDFTALPFIERGGHGVVTVSGNVVPRQMSLLCSLAGSGQSAAAKGLDDTLQPLNKMLFVESNPIPVKWALGEMGLLEPHIRLPLTPFSAEHHENMRSAMRIAGVDLEKTV